MERIFNILTLAILAYVPFCLGGCGNGSNSNYWDVFFVEATVETDQVPNDGDAADDVCIWIHPSDTSQSTIIATDKKGGIIVYDLAGRELQYLADGNMNNVDIRYNFPLGDKHVAIVSASNRTNNSIAIYQINPQTRELESVAGGEIYTGIDVYGLCMFHSPLSGKYFVFVTSTNGVVQQWELFDDGGGAIEALLMRTFDVGSKSEGCVADDELQYLYIAEEGVAIWKYPAEPETKPERLLVDLAGNHFAGDVEGLTIYYANNLTGYLIASNQQNNTFVIYKREESNEYVTTFGIEEGNGIDEVSGTDGVDVINFNLGDAFPEGLFVAQDDVNSPGENQNFKLVPWEAIANSVEPTLTIDVSWDPRLIGR